MKQEIWYSVIVVCLNAGNKLLETVESIVSQTYERYEIIIKDGGSSDGSIEAVQKYGGKIRIITCEDSGIYDAMNQAVSYAKGMYYLFLNAGDSFYDKKVLEKITHGILSEVQSLGGIPDIVYGNLYHKTLDTVIYASPKMNAFTCYRNVPCHQTCFYHKRLFETRGYEPKYNVRADYEHFLWCYFKTDARISYQPLLVASYEGGGYSETPQNRKKSAQQHKEITVRYMGRGWVFLYQLLLVLTLAPLRSKIAESERLSKGYNKLKTLVYRRFQ